MKTIDTVKGYEAAKSILDRYVVNYNEDAEIPMFRESWDRATNNCDTVEAVGINEDAWDREEVDEITYEIRIA